MERSEQGGPYVYVIGSEDGERIKVGWSGQDDWSRLEDHRRGDAFGAGGDFTVLAVVRGTRQCEDKVHRYYQQHYLASSKNTETFRAAPLVPYVTWLRDQYFVSTTEAEFHSPAGRKVVEPTLWLPSDGRISHRRAEASLFTEVDPWSMLPSRVVTGDDWYTPEHIVEVAREALGGAIDLDPASHVVANEKVKARQFFTIDQNGLTQPWHGRVWLNPPFSSWPQWVEKVLHEAATVEAMVLLGASRTLTANYFNPLLDRSDAFCVIKGRDAFWGINSGSQSPTDGFFLLYIGPMVERFVAAAQTLGVVFVSPTAQRREGSDAE